MILRKVLVRRGKLYCNSRAIGSRYLIGGTKAKSRANLGADSDAFHVRKKLTDSEFCLGVTQCGEGRVTYVLLSKMIEVQEYLEPQGGSPFADWFAILNPKAAAKVATTLTRLSAGNFSKR
jgi:hypothetical protein